MNKLLTKIAGLSLGVALALGVGIAVSHNDKAIVHAEGDVVAYEFEVSSSTSTGNNAYADSGDVTINGIEWTVEGNGTTSPWRIGGKKIAGVDRKVYSKSAVSAENISKVELSVGGASSITVNSLSLIASTSAGGDSDVVSTVSQTFSANSTITFTRPEAADWSNKHFTFKFNVTVSGTSNKFVEFKGAKFYYEPSGEEEVKKYDVTYTAGDNGTGNFVVAEQNEGQYTLLDFNLLEGVSAADGYRFKDYTVGEEIKNPGETITLSENTNITVNFEALPDQQSFQLYSGDLVEGDYLIVYDGVAMNTTVSSDRLQYTEVEISGDVIYTELENIVWHIAPSGDYWTLYNSSANKYAASTGAKNKAQMLVDGTDDKALWTASGSETYEFVNKANKANSVNANLRKNGTYGFACYATATGGELSLYKLTGGEIIVHNYVDLYYANNRSWENVYAYAWNDADATIKNADWPGVKLSKVDINKYHEDIYTYHLDTNEWDRVIFNNGGNGEQTENINISEAKTLDQYYLNQDLGGGTWSVAKATYVPHGTQLDDPLSVEEALAKAQALGAGEYSELVYYVKGTVVAGVDTYSNNTPCVYESTKDAVAKYYGRVHIGSEESKLLIYNLLDFDGGTNFTEDLLAIGNEIAVHGKLQKYVNKEVTTLEISSGPVLDSVNGYGKAEFTAVGSALSKISCDATGVNSTINWAGVMTDLYGYSYLKSVAANENGNRLEQFMAKYDYIVAKYGTSTYQDFLDRQPASLLSESRLVNSISNSSTAIIIVVVSLLGVSAIGGYLFLRKRKENQ